MKVSIVAFAAALFFAQATQASICSCLPKAGCEAACPAGSHCVQSDSYCPPQNPAGGCDADHRWYCISN
ncbi:hypothetical protein O0I10_009613 [Lichtheimia ornata]|uniref:Uncharacterized protein n=1 Tax=Lichtheimia ornata TaxID=688661 RepID=A0AAD7UXX2_9FUNG|nr:uncharacterized protein O0I10_009613 [Lichtheimia ornata]KAJ8654722.1 hypothetical protein O0I10_009613 [Lichtheimia ornata]